jgi:hypothetical protein
MLNNDFEYKLIDADELDEEAGEAKLLGDEEDEDEEEEEEIIV